jgi:hypothetical protein
MTTKSAQKKANAGHQEILARQGLRLPPPMLNQLRSSGIYCQPSISVEHQHLAKRYVLRGVESGGAVHDFGAYVSFIGQDGTPMNWLSRVETVRVNGVHAVVIAAVLIRLEIVRVQRTYDLLITRHSLEHEGGKRPHLKNEILFFGRRGTLELDLCGSASNYRGRTAPVFYTRAGEISVVPAKLTHAVALMTGAVNCVGCTHCHLLQPPDGVNAMGADTDSAQDHELVA